MVRDELGVWCWIWQMEPDFSNTVNACPDELEVWSQQTAGIKKYFSGFTLEAPRNIFSIHALWLIQDSGQGPTPPPRERVAFDMEN